MAEKKSILLIDDDERFRKRLAMALEQRGLKVFEAWGQTSAVAALKSELIAWAVLDLKMPEVSGLDLLPMILKIQPQLRVVVLTGYGSIATAVEAVRRGAVNYLTKPVDADRIVSAFFDRADIGQRTEGSSRVPSLDAVAWEHINRVLEDCSGNVSKASKLLGLHRRSLQRKLAKAPIR